MAHPNGTVYQALCSFNLNQANKPIPQQICWQLPPPGTASNDVSGITALENARLQLEGNKVAAFSARWSALVKAFERPWWNLKSNEMQKQLDSVQKLIQLYQRYLAIMNNTRKDDTSYATLMEFSTKAEAQIEAELQAVERLQAGSAENPKPNAKRMGFYSQI